MNYKIIDGKKLAQVVKDDARERVIKLKELGWTPRLVSIDVGDSAAVSLYIKNQQKAAERSVSSLNIGTIPEASPSVKWARRSMRLTPTLA